jgi:hypothetical protein
MLSQQSSMQSIQDAHAKKNSDDFFFDILIPEQHLY